MNCAELGPDLVALALGQLSGAETAAVEAHVAACAPCRKELDANRRLFGSVRAVAAPGPSATAEARLLAAFRAERDAAPAREVAPPPAAPRRRSSRILSIVLPLAAAATVLVAVVLSSREPPAQIVDGEGIFHPDLDALAPGVVVRGEFAFGEGASIEAGDAPVTFRLSLDAARGAKASDGREPGRVELRLLPAARVRRAGANEIELRGGTIEVTAGPLAAPFTVRAADGELTAIVRGTRFLATTADRRLVVVVREGKVELGRRGGVSETLGAGEQGLVDAERILRRPADAGATGDTLLTPHARLEVDPATSALSGRLLVGEGGPVSILPFDDSEPRFLLRLKGHDGREREVKLQRTMLLATPPGTGSRVWRLEPGHDYGLAIDPAALGLAPGRYEASLRYVSYRGSQGGAEWLGVAVSDPVPFEVPAK